MQAGPRASRPPPPLGNRSPRQRRPGIRSDVGPPGRAIDNSNPSSGTGEVTPAIGRRSRRGDLGTDDAEIVELASGRVPAWERAADCHGPILARDWLG